MWQYIKWFKYLMRHKWYVFVDMVNAGYPIEGLIHDWDKLTYYKFVTYANHHYAPDGEPKGHFKTKTAGYKAGQTGDEPFDECVMDHVKISNHHWHHYYEKIGDDEPVPEKIGCPELLHTELNAEIIYPMPHKYIVEMFADWRSAARVQGTGSNMAKWYDEHRDQMKLHEDTRREIEEAVGYADYIRTKKALAELAEILAVKTKQQSLETVPKEAEPVLKTMEDMQKPYEYDINDIKH